MRQRIGRLGTITALAFAAAIVSAAPAQARNIGGGEPGPDICVQPGSQELRSDKAASAPPCVCVVAEDKTIVRNLGKDPTTECPSGVLHFR